MQNIKPYLAWSAVPVLALGLWLAKPKQSAQPAPELPMNTVVAGSYYVGTVHGQHDYAEHSNQSVQAFAIMRYEVSVGLYESVRLWAEAHGYSPDWPLPNSVEPNMPMHDLDWFEALIFANALSEWQGRAPYYLDSEQQPLRQRPKNTARESIAMQADTNGYRLPTYPEWHIAARGAQLGLANQTYGDLFAGDPEPWFPSNSEAHVHPIGSKTPNALGLFDMTGNVEEWLQSGMPGMDWIKYHCGGSAFFVVASLAQCEMHSGGFRREGMGVRLVRSLL